MPRLLVAAALCALPTLALAEVTPDEVWQEWQSGPVALSAAREATRDGALLLDGVTAELPQGGRMMIVRLTLAPQGDAVRVTASDSARLVARDGAEGALTAPGAALDVSGDPGALTYRLAAPSLALDWTDLPQDAPVSELHIDLTDTEVAIDPTEAGVAARIEAARGALDMTGSDGATRAVVAQNWTDPTVVFDGPFAVLTGLERPDPLDRIALRFDSAGSVTEVVADGPRGRQTIETESDSTFLEATLETGRLKARQSALDTRLTVTPEGVPLDDLTAQIAEFSVAVDAPAVRTTGSEEAQLDLRLTDVTFSEQAWDIVDPGRRLPRDPATLVAELAVRGTVGAPAAPDAPPPVTLERLEIDGLRIDALGARAAIEGQLDWDGAGGLALLDPEGRVSVELQGADALIETLAAAGILTEGQALFAGFGLNSYTRALERQNGRAAEIVFGPGGAISINGTPLR